MLGTGAVVGAVDKSLGIANHVVQPFEQLTIRVEYFPFMVVPLCKRFPVRIESVGLYRGGIGDAISGKGLDGNAIWYRAD